MPMKLTAWVAVMVASAGVAHAGTQHGDQAEGLTYALRYAGVTPTVANKLRTFQISAAECDETLDPGHDLSSYRCTLGKTQVTDAAAYALWTALVGIGYPQTPTGDVTVQIKVKAVSCVLDPSAAYDARFTCTTDVASKPGAISPKPAPVKDVVQPVKIEKQ